jgi:hypothetical protein
LVEKIETKLVQMMFLIAASSAKPMTIFLKAGEASALARSSASMADTILGYNGKNISQKNLFNLRASKGYNGKLLVCGLKMIKIEKTHLGVKKNTDTIFYRV